MVERNAELVPEDQPVSGVVVRGALSTYGSSAALVVMQIGYTAVTARIVTPTQFGVYALSLSVVSLASYFGGSVVGSTLARRQQLEAPVVGTALTLSAASGILVTVVLMVFAPVFAAVWDNSSMIPTLRVASLQVALASVSSVLLGVLRHRYRFGSTSLIDIAATAIGFAVGLAALALGAGAVGLAMNGVANAASVLFLATIALRGWPRLRWSPVEARSLASFAGQVGLQNLGHFALGAAPLWSVGHILGAFSAGFYSRAATLVNLPLTYLATSTNRVVYPVMGRSVGNLGRRSSIMRWVMVSVLAMTSLAFGWLAGCAPSVVAVLLGPGWEAVIPLVRILALLGPVGVGYAVLSNSLEATGHLRAIWTAQVVNLVVLGSSLVSLRILGAGAGWYAAAAVVGGAVALVAQVVASSRLGLLELKWQVLQWGATLAGFLLMAAVTGVVGVASGRLGPLATLLLQTLSAVALSLLLAAGIRSTSVGREGFGLVRRAFGQTSA